MKAKFISNVDPDDAAAVLNSTDVAHSIFVLVSKSGTTLETLTNESFVKDALKKAGLNPSNHMIAVTSETSPLAKSDDYLAAFFMDDYIGVTFLLYFRSRRCRIIPGVRTEVFAQFLEGAAAEDPAFRKQRRIEETRDARCTDWRLRAQRTGLSGNGSASVLTGTQPLPGTFAAA